MEIAKILVNVTTGRCLTRKRIPAGAAGLTVAVEFADPVWESLEKTVMFRGSCSRIATEFDGGHVVIPWEVIETPGMYLHFGIWGTDPASDLQLPLIEVPIGLIESATDPEADPGSDPTLPIWALLQERVQRLEEQGTGGASTSYDESTGELTITGSTVAYDEATGELTI